MLDRTYWKASSSYSNGLLLPTAKNVYQNSSIIPGQPIDKSIATSWYKTKFSTISRNDRAQTSKHEIKEYNVFSVFSTLSGNSTVAYNYMGSGLRYSGSGWDVTRFICGIDTSVINLFVPVILYSSTKPTVTVNAIKFINNFKDYKDYDYAILGRPVKNAGYGSTEFSLHFIIENEQYGAILQFSGIDNFTSVANHQWTGGNMCQANFTGSNTATARYAESNELMVKSDNYPRVWIMPYASEELEDGKDFNAYNKFLSSFEKYVVVEEYSGVERAAWSPDVIYELIRHIGIPLRDTTSVTSETQVYIPMVDENGYHSGEWVLSTDKKAKESSLYKAQTDQNTIDPTKPPTPGGDDDDYPNLSLDVIGATGLATGVSWFVMNETDMATLSKLGVYHSDPTVIETPWETINKANAVAKASEDAIISILQFPYDISMMHSAEGRHGTIRVYVPGVFNSDSEWFGASACYTGAQGGYITDLNRIVNAGSATITTRAGTPTFLDFEPYTSLQMYVPFAGWVSLPCSQCMGATVALQYVIDPPTGSGRAFISANGCIIKDIPFTIGSVTPTSVHQTGPLMGPLMNTAFGVAGTIAGAAVAAETGGLSATMGASMAVGAVSNLSNTLMDSCVPKTHTIGTNGTAITSFPTPKTPTILINRPRIKIPDNMGHRYGYACDKEAVLADLSGMTVCSNVDTTGINATANEKSRLKAILESGFYA